MEICQILQGLQLTTKKSLQMEMISTGKEATLEPTVLTTKRNNLDVQMASLWMTSCFTNELGEKLVFGVNWDQFYAIELNFKTLR